MRPRTVPTCAARSPCAPGSRPPPPPGSAASACSATTCRRQWQTRVARHPHPAGRQRDGAPRARVDPVLVGRRSAPGRVRPGAPRPARRGGGAAPSAPEGDAGRGRRAVGPRPLGREVRRARGQAEGVGARLGIEFFPWSNVGSLDEGLRLVEEAGHDNGGVIIDTWHVARANTPIVRPRGRPAAPHRRRGARRCRRARRRDAVRGHRPPPAVLRRGRVRPGRHGRGPAQRGVDAGPGVSRSSPTSTGP